jgi:hypothetical protein
MVHFWLNVAYTRTARHEFKAERWQTAPTRFHGSDRILRQPKRSGSCGIHALLAIQARCGLLRQEAPFTLEFIPYHRFSCIETVMKFAAVKKAATAIQGDGGGIH